MKNCVVCVCVCKFGIMKVLLDISTKMEKMNQFIMFVLVFMLWSSVICVKINKTSTKHTKTLLVFLQIHKYKPQRLKMIKDQLIKKAPKLSNKA